jgi:hypothetical protein
MFCDYPAKALRKTGRVCGMTRRFGSTGFDQNPRGLVPKSHSGRPSRFSSPKADVADTPVISRSRLAFSLAVVQRRRKMRGSLHFGFFWN